MLNQGLVAPLLVIIVLAMMILPLPAILLDLFFTFNIALSLIILMVVIYVARPLEFAAFPTILLIATLMRLSLNIASTRVVLLEGHTGTGAAGKVIEAFGEFVIGGNYAVGLVIFSILVIINFVVVTKGAGRIAEVSARFTLDALPGKQMAIDADLNAGLIGQDEALQRRKDVAQEADFYGSMDGANKFVRGDAVAGIIILFINVIGGLSIGMSQHDLSFDEAMHNYTLLTIGDGLVAQIPSLMLSTAAAMIITRVSSAQDMGKQISDQMFSNPKPLIVTASILGGIGIIPGMPNVAFLTLATLLGGAAYLLNKRDREAALEPLPEQNLEAEAVAELKELSWDDVPVLDTIGLEVGYGLISLVDREQGGQLMERIKGVRKKVSQELGILIQSVHIRDNLELLPNVYRINLSGVLAGEGEIYSDRELAIDPGTVYGSLQGIETKDPAFGMDSLWIEAQQKDHAQTLGYTVVDASTVIATHLSKVLQSNSAQLLGYEEVQQLLDRLTLTAPKLVEGLVPNMLSLAVVVKVLKSLLSEGVPIRDMRTIVETLSEFASRTQEPNVLIAHVRVALGKIIVQEINGVDEKLPVITLDSALEQLLQNSVQDMNNETIVLEPNMAERLHGALNEITQQQEVRGEPAVLAVSPPLRNGMAKWLKHAIPSLVILSYNEIPDHKQIKIISTIGNNIQ
ncbi:MAG: flagellar biosynthesis protein FlhA [Gammaproteobacteria bacterium]|nr:flagellar biosynthesis protein FlhA [Gammaproteobacteria bacterium]